MDFLTFCNNFKSYLYKRLPKEIDNETFKTLSTLYSFEFIQEYKKQGWEEQNLYIVNNLETNCYCIVEQMIFEFYKK